jgi:hypothetical protein
MSTIVKDVLFIKTIEKAIGRKLDDLELECIEYGEPIFVQYKNGTWASYVVPTYNMPHDLMPKGVDLFEAYALAVQNSKSERNPNIWASEIYNVITNAKAKIANSIKATYE